MTAPDLDAARRLEASAVEQGFPLKVTDPSVLKKIAAILAADAAEKSEREAPSPSPRARHRRLKEAAHDSTPTA